MNKSELLSRGIAQRAQAQEAQRQLEEQQRQAQAQYQQELAQYQKDVSAYESAQRDARIRKQAWELAAKDATSGTSTIHLYSDAGLVGYYKQFKPMIQREVARQMSPSQEGVYRLADGQLVSARTKPEGATYVGPLGTIAKPTAPTLPWTQDVSIERPKLTPYLQSPSPPQTRLQKFKATIQNLIGKERRQKIQQIMAWEPSFMSSKEAVSASDLQQIKSQFATGASSVEHKGRVYTINQQGKLQSQPRSPLPSWITGTKAGLTPSAEYVYGKKPSVRYAHVYLGRQIGGELERYKTKKQIPKAPSWLVSSVAELPTFAAFQPFFQVGASGEEEAVLKFKKRTSKGKLIEETISPKYSSDDVANYLIKNSKSKEDLLKTLNEISVKMNPAVRNRNMQLIMESLQKKGISTIYDSSTGSVQFFGLKSPQSQFSQAKIEVEITGRIPTMEYPSIVQESGKAISEYQGQEKWLQNTKTIESYGQIQREMPIYQPARTEATMPSTTTATMPQREVMAFTMPSTILKSKQDLFFRSSQQKKQMPKTALLPKTRLSTREKARERAKLTSVWRTAQTEKLIPRLRQPVPTKLGQPTPTRLKTPGRYRTPRRYPPRLRPPRIPIPFEFPFPRSKRKKKLKLKPKRKPKDFFVAEVKRYGKWIPVSKPTKFGLAFAAGTKKVKETLGASLRVRETKTGKLALLPTSKKFRRGKKDPLSLVERRKFRLDMPSEIKEIITAKRAKKSVW
jgi:hypothetical protein